MVGQGDRDRTLGFLSKELRKERKGERYHEWKGVDASPEGSWTENIAVISVMGSSA